MLDFDFSSKDVTHQFDADSDFVDAGEDLEELKNDIASDTGKISLRKMFKGGISAAGDSASSGMQQREFRGISVATNDFEDIDPYGSSSGRPGPMTCGGDHSINNMSISGMFARDRTASQMGANMEMSLKSL